MKKIYVSGNGNVSWEKFQQFYIEPLKKFNLDECEFIIGDFSGTDTLMMEFLKDKTEKVTILHVGKRPRYFANSFKQKLKNGKLSEDLLQIMKEIPLELIYALIFWRLISIPMKKEKAEH